MDEFIKRWGTDTPSLLLTKVVECATDPNLPALTYSEVILLQRLASELKKALTQYDKRRRGEE
jgi:hypothetical protein